MASEIRAGRAYVELFLKGDFKKGLDAASKQLKQFGEQITSIGKKLAGIGASVTAPLLLAAQRFAAMGDEINKASQRTGVGVEALSALKYAAEQSGASFEDLESGIKKMQKAVFEAQDGSSGAAKAISSLGLSVAQISSLKPDEQFVTLGNALSGVEDAGTRAALAMEIFGKGGTQLLPLFANGANGINALVKRADELGLVIGKDDAEAATRFGDICDDLWKQVQAVTFAVGAAIAQALQPFAEATTHILAGVIAWAKQNKALIIGVLAAGLAFIGAGSAVIALGLSFTLLGAVLSGIGAAIGLVGSAIALLFSPIGLVIGGLVALAYWFATSTKVGGEAIAWLGTKFDQLQQTASEAFGGIADALGAGDILLAAKILWTGLQAAWAEGSQELMGYWYKFKANFIGMAAVAFYGAQELWENVKSALQASWAETSAFFQTAWANTTAFLGGLWDGFVNTFTNAWDVAVNSVAKGLNYIRSLWDKTFDPKVAAQLSDQMLADAQKQRDQADITAAQKREADRQAATDGIEAARKAKRAEIANNKDRAVSDIEGRESATIAGADQQSKDSISALEKRKKDLQSQLDDLRDKSRGAKKKKDADAGPIGLTDAQKLSTKQVLDNRMDVSSPAKAQGIFGAMGLQSLQTGPAKSATETAKNTAELVKLAKEDAKKRQKFQ